MPDAGNFDGNVGSMAAIDDGKSLVASRLRKEHGLTVVAVQRGEKTHLNPDPAWVFEPGDRAHVFGEQDVISDKAGLFIGHDAPDDWA